MSPRPRTPSKPPRPGSSMRSRARGPSPSRGRPQSGLRRPRASIFRQPISWGWAPPWLAGPGAAPEPPAAAGAGAEPAPEPPVAAAPDDAGAPDAAGPPDAASAAGDASPPGDAAPAAGAEEPPQGELPPTVWAGGRRLTVRWFARPRPLGPTDALGAPTGGGVYVVLMKGAPMAAHVTRDFGRDLTRRLEGGTRRPAGLTIWYARVDGTETLPKEGWRQLARGVRRAIGLPPVPTPTPSPPSQAPSSSAPRRGTTGSGRPRTGARA